MIEERNTRMVREEDDEMDDGEAGNSMDTRIGRYTAIRDATHCISTLAKPLLCIL